MYEDGGNESVSNEGRTEVYIGHKGTLQGDGKEEKPKNRCEMNNVESRTIGEIVEYRLKS